MDTIEKPTFQKFPDDQVLVWKILPYAVEWIDYGRKAG
jgi:hypothetical protein